jgi:uncharacterized membrane protein YphA (DoxX/SURF4 family)/thiol-disulfide isomerase/thioredoxin
MDAAILVARLLLAGVFIVAGVGKLADLPGFRDTLRGFRVGERLARVGAVALPIAELAMAAALLAQPLAIWGAAAALLLLLAFTGAIVNALARGDAPDCGCFGTLQSAAVGRRQVIRNAVLAALAVFVATAGPGPAIVEHGASAAIALLLGAATCALLALALQLWRERGGLREQLTAARRIAAAVPPGLGVGAPAPSFSVRGANGDPVTLDDLRARGRPVALVFCAQGCGPCSALAPELPRWQAALAGTLTIGLVGVDTYLRYEEAAGPTGATVQEVYDRDPVLAEEADELNGVLAAYRLTATPSAVLVTPEGTIASATVDGRLAIEALIRLAVTRRGAPGLQVAHG